MPVVKYAVTQTLNKRQQANTVLGQLLACKMITQQAFKQMPNVTKIDTVFELTQRGKIHSHSLFYVLVGDERGAELIPPLLYTEITRRMGFSCIKICNDEAGWLSYMNKEIEQTTRSLNAVLQHFNQKERDQNYVRLHLQREHVQLSTEQLAKVFEMKTDHEQAQLLDYMKEELGE